MTLEQRRQPIEPDHPSLLIVRQCQLVSISRSGFYHRPVGETAENLALMRVIDAQFRRRPGMARARWRAICSVRVMSLARRAHPTADGDNGAGADLPAATHHGAEPGAPDVSLPAARPGDRPAKPDTGAPTSPSIRFAAQVQMRRGFLYLVGVMDWATRKVLAWRVSDTMDTVFCIDAPDEALARHERPGIFNTDQGSQFTSPRFADVPKAAGVRILMDGRGRWMDNVFIERLRCRLKYECVYCTRSRPARSCELGSPAGSATTIPEGHIPL
jgi:putative transposase